MHLAVDTLGHLLMVKVTAASEQERERVQVEELATQLQEVTGESVELAYVDTASRQQKRRASGWKW